MSVGIVTGPLAETIRRLRESGVTYQAIADTLNAEQVPTLRGAAQWRVSSVQSAAGYKRRTVAAPRADLPTLPKRRRTRAAGSRLVADQDRSRAWRLSRSS